MIASTSKPADPVPPILTPDHIHAQLTAHLARSAGDGIELMVAGLRASIEEAGEVPEEVEAAIGRIVCAAVELRNMASTMEGSQT